MTPKSDLEQPGAWSVKKWCFVILLNKGHHQLWKLPTTKNCKQTWLLELEPSVDHHFWTSITSRNKELEASRNAVNSVVSKPKIRFATKLNSTARSPPASNQVWPLTHFFSVCFRETNILFREDTVLVCSFQQLPCLSLGPLKGFLSWPCDL